MLFCFNIEAHFASALATLMKHFKKNHFLVVATFATQFICNTAWAAHALLCSVPQQVSEQVALSIGPIFNHVSIFNVNFSVFNF
jgi:hypothetical protein